MRYRISSLLLLILCLLNTGLILSAQEDTLPLDSSQWQALSPMSLPRAESDAVVIDGKIYVIGGLAGATRSRLGISDLLEVYDPQTDTWETLAAYPTVIHHPIAAAYDGKLYVFGGSDNAQFRPIADAFVYDPASDTWEAIAALPAPRMATDAVVLDDFIYIAGGEGGRDVLRYDPANNSWATLAPSEREQDHASVVLLNETIYVLGGRAVFSQDFDTVAIYEPQTDTWDEVAPMQQERAGFGAARINEQLIVVAGGELLAGQNTVLSDVELYDAQADVWQSLPDLPQGLHGMPIITLDDRLYIIGGLGEGTIHAQLRVIEISAAE